MCSFIFTSRAYRDLAHINHYLAFRGPDHCATQIVDKYHFIHNLLSVTGEFRPQPFVRENLFCLYNGQIYNYTQFDTHAKSDGDILLPLYEQYGPSFVKQLDGEFALVLLDLNKQLLLISSDTFGTKPLWYAIEAGDIAVASYPSALYGLGFKQVQKAAPNTALVLRLPDYEITSRITLTEFDLSQHKIQYNDCLTAFSQAVTKRSAGTREKIFIGLSSGYDSGALACELAKQGVDFRAYNLRADENPSILTARFEKLPQIVKLNPSKTDYLSAKTYLQTHCETLMDDGYDFKRDKGAVGVSLISAAAKADGYTIHFSGQGADEILSDYGRYGEKIYAHSTLAGLFPDDLRTVFPWPNFFGGTQAHYLMKEEFVGGAYGLETRYPFLDKAWVQEFLWLAPALKNQYYKAPLHVYLKKEHFPFEHAEKIGFRANKNLRSHFSNWKEKIRDWF